MFPGVDGFHWSPIHVVFLTLFGLVLATIFATLSVALWRTRRDLRDQRTGEICWLQDFEDLPEAERRCRHALTGVAPNRVCPRGFDCRDCQAHEQLATLERQTPIAMETGLNYPPGRFYHRGHAWVELQDDGAALVGLDDLGSRIVGTPDRIELPRRGAKLHLNAPAWTMIRGSSAVTVRAPMDGEVIDVGGPESGWLLKLWPAPGPVPVRHLLTGAEVSPWLRSELDRLQLMLSASPAGATLADGGMLVPDLRKAMPDAPWDDVYASLFQKP